MTQHRPLTVLLAFLLVVAQIVISLAATVTAALAPADYRTYATTTPAFLLVLYAAVAYYLWAGRAWARTLALVIAVLGLIGNLSVILYYDHTATVAVQRRRPRHRARHRGPAAGSGQPGLLQPVDRSEPEAHVCGRAPCG